MEKIRVLFGTPEAIWYRETDERLGYDLDISCKVSGAVTIFEYPEDSVRNAEPNDRRLVRCFRGCNAGIGE